MNPQEAAEAMTLMELVEAIEYLAMRNVFLHNEKSANNYERNAEEATNNEKIMTIYAVILCRKVRKELGK